MLFIVDGKDKHLSLKRWNTETLCWEDGGRDCFLDFEDELPGEATASGRVCNIVDYTAMIDFWENECARYNRREKENFFCDGLPEEEIGREFARNIEYIFLADM